MDEKQLAALIDAAVREAVQRTSKELAAKFEHETQGLRDSRDTILREKKALEGKAEEERKELSLDAAIKRVTTDYSTPTPKSTEPVVSKRGDSPQEYQAADALAKERGVRHVIEDDRDLNGYGQQPPQSSPVKVFETEREFFVNKTYIEMVGIVRAKAMAEERGKPLIAFKDPQQLPAEAAEKHKQVLNANDPVTLLFDGEGG